MIHTEELVLGRYNNELSGVGVGVVYVVTARGSRHVVLPSFVLLTPVALASLSLQHMSRPSSYCDASKLPACRDH